jgi:hypothetical protein
MYKVIQTNSGMTDKYVEVPGLSYYTLFMMNISPEKIIIYAYWES